MPSARPPRAPAGRAPFTPSGMSTVMSIVSEEAVQEAVSGIAKAKRDIARSHDLAEWALTELPLPITVHRPHHARGAGDGGHAADAAASASDGAAVVEIGSRTFRDNTPRVDGSTHTEPHGDTLPETPTVLTGCCSDWRALRDGSWSIASLAERTTQRLSLDGGPGFARESMCTGKVSAKEYARYCAEGADSDAAPLYIFDPDILNSTFADAQSTPVKSEYSVPTCFANDAMGCLTGTRYRPLPPAWLLVGAVRSGTPIHDHPCTVAWNALLAGCKLWCCLPPDVDESLLLLNLDPGPSADVHGEEGGDGAGGADGDVGGIADDVAADGPDVDSPFDIAAIDWFARIGNLPKEAKIIVQQPGEVVFLPAGWFHVVLNVETSTAISVSLTLRKDLHRVLPVLYEQDPDFATFWIERLKADGGLMAREVGVTLDEMMRIERQLELQFANRATLGDSL